MTREEALKFFGGTGDPDELQDAYEEQLFEYKQFFLSKAPVSKLFEGRMGKLRKLGDAYGLLADLDDNERIVTNPGTDARPSKVNFPLPSKEGTFIIEAYKSFQEQKNELKRLISNATSAQELIHLAQSLIHLEKQNAAQWSTALESEDGIIVSREPDPMYLLEAIKTYNKQDGETFAQLKNLENNPPEILIQEMKRLSLLFKKF